MAGILDKQTATLSDLTNLFNKMKRQVLVHPKDIEVCGWCLLNKFFKPTNMHLYKCIG